MFGFAVHLGDGRVEIDHQRLTRLRPGTRALANRRLATASSWRTWPNVNVRRNVPRVDGANGLNPNTLDVDPERNRSIASMLVAPAIMPNTKDITLTAGFAAPV